MAKKIYVSSQNFGFGPTSNLFAILKNLKSKSNKIKIYALHNEAMGIFSRINHGIVDYNVDKIDFHNVDLVFSSFDPFAILNAWLLNIPNIFYCNLFWYWDVFNKKEQIIHHLDQLNIYKDSQEKYKAREYFRNIFDKNPHEGIFMGFLLASKCFTRKFHDIDRYLNAYSEYLNISITDIYIPYELKLASRIKKTVLFQLSGSRNPVVNLEENIIYVNLCVQVTKHLANSFNSLEFAICINPFLLEKINVIDYCLPINVKIISSVSQEQNLKMMEESLAMFTSPGLETIYEGIYTHCPIFLLPEQNAGQYSIFQMLNSSGYEPKRFLINELFPNRKKLYDENDAHNIYGIIKDEILNSEKIINTLFKDSQHFIALIMNQQEREKYLQMSLDSIKTRKDHDPFTTNDQVSDYIIMKYI